MFMRFTVSILLAWFLSIHAFAESTPAAKLESAVLAGGCFWCIEADYEKLDGVVDVVSGYTGGHVKNPTYKQVSAGGSGHIEVVKVTYDANKINYSQILDYFWRHIDPTRDDGQFCDRGPQYRPAIFYQDEAQKELAIASIKQVEQTKPFAQPLKVELIQATTFYPAEDYHQDYYKKNPIRYNFYRYNCGRDARVEQLWGESKK
ncbi:MAG: peptide-methionine (S)-S-oxide reductase MsrA [Gammaproteobacteria bacterium]|nr:peptide-methionine (S)-S-oxide reductase MsrA [Gammaproteobacteria bacterium]